MIGFVARRSVQLVLTMVVASTLIFMIVHMTPGDPVMIILEDYFQQETYDAVSARLGLDQPLITQYLRYVTSLVQGHWGTSFRSGQDVLTMILDQFPYTLKLAIASILVAIVIGIPAGVISAVNRNRWPDYAAMISALLAVCMPGFFLAILLLLVFSVHLRWFPLVGAGDPDDLRSTLLYLALPALALGSRMAALLARITRASVLDVQSQDYIRTARAKGLGERLIMLRHISRNAAIPVITVIGLDVGSVLGGSAIIEIVFGRPGVGHLLVDALLVRDYPVVQGALVFITLMVLAVNLVVDILYSRLDPRISLS